MWFFDVKSLRIAGLHNQLRQWIWPSDSVFCNTNCKAVVITRDKTAAFVRETVNDVGTNGEGEVL